MGKKAKVAVGIGIALAILIAAVGYAEWRLRAEQLTPAVNAALAEAGLKGQVGRVEAKLSGSFTVSAVDLTLPDGTVAKVESAVGDLAVLALLGGKVRLEELEAKGIAVVVGTKKDERGQKGTKEDEAGAGLGLGRFSVGKLAASGRVRLADGQDVRFNARSEGVDFSRAAELRAGVAWNGRPLAGKAATDPRAEVVVRATFRRTLGDAGLAPRELARDLERLDLRVTTRDAGPLALGGPSLTIAATTEGETLALTVDMKDAKGMAAFEGKGALAAKPGEALNLTATLNLAAADLGLLAPSDPALPARAKGRLVATAAEDGAWTLETELLAAWADLGKFSPSIEAGTAAEWTLRATAKGRGAEAEVTQAALAGPGGLSVRIDKPLLWRGGLLPADSSGGAIRVAAADAPLSALAPFLASAGIVPVEGTWSGSLEIAFVGGEAFVTSARAPAVSGLALERDGKPWLSGLNATLPLRADRKGLALDGFEAGMGGRRLVSGTASIRPADDGGWAADGRLSLDLGDLAGQPGWENLPFEKLRGTMVDLTASAKAATGKSAVISGGQGRIRRGEVTLLGLRQRADIDLGQPLPAGPLATAKAENLPLETLSALVPGLGLTGTLERADLTLGARSDGSWYVRGESGPLVFARASVAWDGTPYLDDCDLTTEMDLSFGAKAVLRFTKTDLRSRGRTLASGSATVPLDGSWPTGEVAGELGALATQPFAGGLGQVAGGTYRATLAPAPNAGVTAEVTVRDAGFRDRALRINAARLAATLTTEATGRRVEGAFRLGASGETAGTFALTFGPDGADTRWQAKVDVAEIVVEDLLGLAPPETDAATAATDPAEATPDSAPAWAGNVGTLVARVGKARLGALTAENLELNATLEPTAARVTSLTGTVVGGALAGEARLLFARAQPRGPYVLTAAIKLAGADLAALGKALPGMEGNLEGKVDARVLALAAAPRLGALADNLAAEIALDSTGGRARLPAALASSAEVGGEVAEGLAGIAALGAAFGKGRDAERAALAANSLIAMRELQKSATDFRFQKLEVRAQRLPDGTLKVSKAEARGPELGIALAGQVTMLPATDVADWPLRFAASIRGGGRLGEALVALGFDPGTPSADGLRQGPAFDIAGSLNDVRTNLVEALREGSRAGRRAPATPSPTQGAPTGPGGFLPFGR